MRERQARGECRGHWWGVLWPRAPGSCSRGSRVRSVLAAPFALLLGMLLAVGLIVVLPLIAAAFVISDRLLGGPQLTTDDVAPR